MTKFKISKKFAGNQKEKQYEASSLLFYAEDLALLHYEY